MKFCKVTLIATFVCSTQAIAAQLPGAGATSCGQFLEFHAANILGVDGTVLSWTQGFLTGMNLSHTLSTRKEPIDLPDSASLLAYLVKYCQDNPLKSIWEGNMKLYFEIAPKQ